MDSTMMIWEEFKWTFWLHRSTKGDDYNYL